MITPVTITSLKGEVVWTGDFIAGLIFGRRRVEKPSIMTRDSDKAILARFPGRKTDGTNSEINKMFRENESDWRQALEAKSSTSDDEVKVEVKQEEKEEKMYDNDPVDWDNLLGKWGEI